MKRGEQTRTLRDMVRADPDFIAGDDGQLSGKPSVCLRDGCGTANFHGALAWADALRFLGLKLPPIEE